LDVNNVASFGPGGASFNHVAIHAVTSNFGTGSAPFNFVAARLKLLLAREQRQNPPTMYA
jgi:hypothetical protein